MTAITSSEPSAISRRVLQLQVLTMIWMSVEAIVSLVTACASHSPALLGFGGDEWGCLRGCRYLLHDRDAKFCQSFRELIKTGSVNPLRLPARSPNLNSYAERWVRSVKEECLSRLILFGESSLRRALQQYIVHYHAERNHQGKDNRILFPSQTEARRNKGAVRW